MSPWQAVREIRRILLAATYPVVGGAVFADVIASDAPIERIIGYEVAYPIAAVRAISETTDPKHEGIVHTDLEVVCVQRLADTTADRAGQTAMIGDGTTRGVLEIAERARIELGLLGRQNGVSVLMRSMRQSAPGRILGALVRTAAAIPQRITTGVTAQSASPFSFVSLGFLAVLTAARTYEAASGVDSTNLGAGSARITWTDPPLRFDRVGAGADVQVRRAAGAVPPATAADGLLVANVALGVQTRDDASGVGQFSYSVFGRYDEWQDGVADVTSDAGPTSGTTVTVT